MRGKDIRRWWEPQKGRLSKFGGNLKRDIIDKSPEIPGKKVSKSFYENAKY
jgi:hypothetical protein